jgi:hypothetical protein
LLWLAETIAAQAQKDDDARLALQAVDRARASMETMMRATGMIGGEQVNIHVDARTQVAAKLAPYSDLELRLIAEGKPIPERTRQLDATAMQRAVPAPTDSEGRLSVETVLVQRQSGDC